jgi:Flp pilus assembly protein TadG
MENVAARLKAVFTRTRRSKHGWQNLNNHEIRVRSCATFAQCLFAKPTLDRNELELQMLAILTRKLAFFRRRSFAKHQEGAAALEFAIVAAPFIALLVAGLQTALAFFAGQVLESAVADSSREILTGSAQNGNLDQNGFAQQVCSKVEALFACPSLMVDVQTASSFAAASTAMPTLTYNAQGQVNNNWAYNPGNPGDIVVVRVMYLWPTFLGPLGFSLSNQSNGSLLLMATAVFKNEPYVPTGT